MEENLDFEKEQIRLFVQTINNKIKELKSITSDCWVCGEKTNFWIALIPEKEPDDLGIGIATGASKTRVAFAPVCEKHDLKAVNTRAKLIEVLRIKGQILKN